jgi:hypothetical protein
MQENTAVMVEEETQQSMSIQPSLLESLEREETLQRPDEALEILKRMERKLDDYRRDTEVLAGHSAKVTRDVEVLCANWQIQQEQMRSLLQGVEAILELAQKIVESGVQAAPRGGTTAAAPTNDNKSQVPWQRAAGSAPKLGEPFTIGHCPTHGKVNLNRLGKCVACCNEATKALYAQRQAVT